MDTYDTIAIPPPGEYIRDELEAREWTQRDLAFVLGCPEQAVNMIIAGKRGISPDMAKLLGDAFDVPAEFFLNLQKLHELARAKSPDPSVAKRAALQSQYPLREMIKRGWIQDTSIELLEAQIIRFFRVATIKQVPHMNHAGKKTHYDKVPPEQLAWLFRVRQIADSAAVEKYSDAKLRKSLPELHALMSAPEESRKVPALLANCGVRFVLVEALPRSKIDGVCFWLNSSSPVIGMSARYDRIDNFWFVLRHEIEHVLRGHGKDREILDAELEGANCSSTSDAIAEKERAANRAAQDFCVPNEELEKFVLRVQPFFSEQRIALFAQRLGVHPGIVVGQLQRRQDDYTFLNRLKVKIREIASSAALQDGWGMPAPVSL